MTDRRVQRTKTALRQAYRKIARQYPYHDITMTLPLSNSPMKLISIARHSICTMTLSTTWPTVSLTKLPINS